MDDNRPRADFFIDGQNLFLTAKSMYGYRHPNFDVVELCTSLAQSKGFQKGRIHFYTGMPGATENPEWHEYWQRRFDALRASGVQVFSSPLRYRLKREYNQNGRLCEFMQPTEKGIDVRIALDIVKSSLRGCRALFLLSQDNDLSIAMQEANDVAQEARRRISLFSAYPVSDHVRSRGVEGTTWVPMTREFYDSHLDPREFRSEHMRARHEELDRRRQNHVQHWSHAGSSNLSLSDATTSTNDVGIAADELAVHRAHLAATAIPTSRTLSSSRPG